MLKKIILTVPILILIIYIFQIWLDTHNTIIIKNNIQNNHLLDKNNADEINYTINPYSNKKNLKIPWGINKLELKTLMNYDSIIDENKRNITFSGPYVTTSFYFNKNSQLYRIEDLRELYYLNENLELFPYNYSSAYLDIEKGYLANITGKENLPIEIIELAWIDDFGNKQKKIMDKYPIDLYELYKIMNLEYNDTVLFCNLVSKNNLTIKRIWNYNNTSLELIIRKYNKTKVALEIVIENTSLKDKN